MSETPNSQGVSARAVAEAVAHSAVPLVVIDEDQRIAVCNEALCDLLGRPRNQVLGAHCYEVLDGCDVFGNPYCVPGCPMARVRRLGTSVRPFQLVVSTALGRRRMWFVPIALGEPEPRASYAYVLLDAEVPNQTTAAQRVPATAEPPRSAPRERTHRSSWTPRHRSSRPPARSSSRPPEQLSAPAVAVTARERDVLRQLAEGAETEAIAARLGISTSTVRNHVQSILRKLDAHSRLEAVAFARRLRLI